MNGEYDNTDQHDCQEFLRNLLQQIHNENNDPKVFFDFKQTEYIYNFNLKFFLIKIKQCNFKFLEALFKDQILQKDILIGSRQNSKLKIL